MLPYFPLPQEQYKMTMGTQALDPDLIIEVDQEEYHKELMLKAELLHEEHSYYFQGAPETLDLQWETVEQVLPTMPRRYPNHFHLTMKGKRWHWQNRLLESEQHFVLGESDSLPLAPLDWLGRQVQEDLLLLRGDSEAGIPLVAGQLCFPNDWCLQDKIGQSLLTIHGPVPLFAEEIGRSTLLLLERLKVGRPVWRLNWGFKGSSRLNLTPRFSGEQQRSCQQITADTIGQACFLRVERQTLMRLPRTRGILFTVHTYQSPIVEEVNNKEHVQRMISVIQTMPATMAHYKGMISFNDLLLAYLQKQLP